MSASPLDSALYRDLFTDLDTAKLFTDTAELRAMLLTWGALAIAQAKHGQIPQTAAKAIQRAAMEIQIDPGALAASTGQNADPIPALLAEFRREMAAPEHAAFVHHGAASQDIIDTALSLRLRQVIALYETRLTAITDTLGSRDQSLLSLFFDLQSSKPKFLLVSLSNTGPATAPNIRADLASGLGLTDPGHNWHTDRTPRTALAAWITQTTVQLGRIGLDVTPQSSVLGALVLQATRLGATIHNHQDCGAAWMAEWLSLPQLACGLGKAFALTQDMTTTP